MIRTTTYQPQTPRYYNGGYRYFFNGQEADNEVLGEGVSLSAEFWQYDTRLGRRWNVDPKNQRNTSVFSCFNNNPVWFVDVKGDTVRYKSGRERIDGKLYFVYNPLALRIKNLPKNSDIPAIETLLYERKIYQIRQFNVEDESQYIKEPEYR